MHRPVIIHCLFRGLVIFISLILFSCLFCEHSFMWRTRVPLASSSNCPCCENADKNLIYRTGNGRNCHCTNFALEIDIFVLSTRVQSKFNLSSSRVEPKLPLKMQLFVAEIHRSPKTDCEGKVAKEPAIARMEGNEGKYFMLKKQKNATKINLQSKQK